MTKARTARDARIGARLRNFRETHMVQRNTFARALGVSADKFVNYEHGRTPLPWGVFVALWLRYSIHPTWLATGEGAQMLAFRGFDTFVEHLDPKAPFWKVYEDELGQFIARQPRKEIGSRAMVDSWDDLDYKGFVPGLPISGSAPSGLARMEILASELPATPKEYPLAKSPQTVISSPVPKPPLTLTALLDRVRASTREHGAQKALALRLKVKPQHLNRWLTGLAEPGGATTLRLLEWVTAAEASQKEEAGRVAARPARKTQAKPPREKKPSSGPPHK